MRSAWPRAMISSTLASLIWLASSSSFFLPDSLSSDLLKSNSTSVASVSFWITGRGGSGGGGACTTGAGGGGGGAGSSLGSGGGATTTGGGGTSAPATRS